jgi:hypothetical protein
MPGRVIGEEPKPRALICMPDNDAMAENLGPLFGSWKAINDLGEVDQQDWDVLVSTRSVIDAEHHLYVITLGCGTYVRPTGQEVFPGCGSFHSPSEPDVTFKGWIIWTGDSRARQFVIPDSLSPNIARLIETQFVPLAQREQIHQWLRPTVVSTESVEDWGNALEPFLLTTRDQCLAGRFPRPGARSECWCFPNYALSLAPQIVEAALREWRKRDPETFPSTDWVNRSRWRTPVENRVANELGELQAERIAMLARMDERGRQLESELAEAKREAETAERLLLTAHGDELVRVAGECLSSLGFEATNMDDLDTGTVRREDMRVTSPDVSDWVALIEIKGYARGGAKVNDLLKLGRYRTEYLKETGSEPHAVWYVVNQFEGEDPSIRPPMLSSDESALDTFAEDNGLAIDTADLFRLWMAVKDERLTAEEARSRLIQARGRFTFED